MSLSAAPSLSWFKRKLYARYAKARYQLIDSLQFEQYLSCHAVPQWNKLNQSYELNWCDPIDLKRVAFTNTSQYQTDYSIFKFISEIESDVLAQGVNHAKQRLFIELFNHEKPDLWINSKEHFHLLGLHTGLVNRTCVPFKTSEILDKLLSHYPGLSRINPLFLKTFAFEFSLKHLIINSISQVHLNHLSDAKHTFHLASANFTQAQIKDANQFTGQHLIIEIKQRIQLMMDSGFFELKTPQDTLPYRAPAEKIGLPQQPETDALPKISDQQITEETLLLIICTIYIHLNLLAATHKQSSQNTPLFEILNTFNHLQETFKGVIDKNFDQTLIEHLSQTHPILNSEKIAIQSDDLYQGYQNWLNSTQ